VETEAEPVETASISPEPLTQEDIDQALAAVLSQYDATAVSVAVIERGQVTQSGASGWAVRNQREMTADTKVRVASLSKVAVGMCAMAMAEDGSLDLDAPLHTYWGSGVGNPYQETQPSVRTLMSHSSSLRDHEITRGLSTLRGILQSNSAWQNACPGDGDNWYYNNFGICVLGTTLELAADQLLDDYFQSKFLQPLDIRASLHAGKLNADEVACLYNSSGAVERSTTQQTGQKVPDQIGMGASYFPGGLTISAVDLAKLVAVLAGDGSYEGTQYLTPESVAEMETPQFTVTPSDRSPFQQCLILRRQEELLGQSVLYYHTGSSYGVYSLLSYNPDTGNGVVVITVGAQYNLTDRGLYALCADLSADLYDKMEGAA
jgi:CubicO group peptidase (beta-lactamase class C family)